MISGASLVYDLMVWNFEGDFKPYYPGIETCITSKKKKKLWLMVKILIKKQTKSMSGSN